jgi:phosphoribosylamine--glycine ligase
MKIALSTYSGYGSWFALRLLSEGHKIDIYQSTLEYAEILEGIAPKPKLIKIDARNGNGTPDYSKYDLSIFDLTGRKQQADSSHMVCPTIGDGSLHCFLEDDRLGGIKLMEEGGVEVPPYEQFTDTSAAKALIRKTGKRFVYKPNGGQDQEAAATYVSEDAEDLLKYIDKLFALSKGSPFILQEFIKGIECSTEGWFNGTDFYLLNCTIEDKKFMNDNKGPNTGCSGNLVFTISDTAKLYQDGLKKMIPVFQQLGFRGMIDLNTILTDEKCYGLEWTPRFGYDASATLVNMYAGDYGEMLYAVAAGERPVENWRAEFGVSARLSIPPYPTEIKGYGKKLRGIPIKGINSEDQNEILKTYLYDAAYRTGKTLEVAGYTGFIACPIEIGSDPINAWVSLQKRIDKINIPDMQYRTDLQKSTIKRYFEVKKMGWI